MQCAQPILQWHYPAASCCEDDSLSFITDTAMICIPSQAHIFAVVVYQQREAEGSRRLTWRLKLPGSEVCLQWTNPGMILHSAFSKGDVLTSFQSSGRTLRISTWLPCELCLNQRLPNNTPAVFAAIHANPPNRLWDALCEVKNYAASEPCKFCLPELDRRPRNQQN